MPLKDIYQMHPEYKEYHYDKFSARLSSLRAIVRKDHARADSDKLSFNVFVQNHEVSLFSNRGGYIQWQGSSAQKLLLQDIEDGLLETLSKKDIWISREEYCGNFPLKVFCDKAYQEIQTAKYLHILKVKGKQYKAS